MRLVLQLADAPSVDDGGAPEAGVEASADAGVEASADAGVVGGVRGSDTLPFDPGAITTVGFALGPHDVGGGWTVRFDQLWCDVE